ncbi:MAG: four helix bundle protein [Verrucomicrobia bacterium]|nr:four helix bundle protein [Verrucomicrobiota bacterium]MCH8527927.1 four helix bundle protein [Kiritimatiellia bacterium]
MEGRENYQDLKRRTQKFALRIIKMARALPNDPAAGVIQKQIIRAGTSVGANYRAACRAKSAADFIHKMKIVEEEADETMYWMELILEENFLRPDQLNALYEEANEILSMTVKSIFTARKGK